MYSTEDTLRQINIFSSNCSYSELLKGAHLKSIHREERAEIHQKYKQTVTYTDYDDKNEPLCSSNEIEP